MKTAITFGILSSISLAGLVVFMPWITFGILLTGYALLILAGGYQHHEANFPECQNSGRNKKAVH